MATLQDLTAKLKKIPPLGWLAIVGGGGAVVYYFYQKNQNASSAPGGITADQSGLALSNLAGMPFESLNPDTNASTDYQPASTAGTDVVSSSPYNTTGPGAPVAAPATTSVAPAPPTDTSPMPGVNAPSTPVAVNPAYTSQNTPGESLAAIEKAYKGCVWNCVHNEKLSAVHCQQKCSTRHPMGGGVGGYDDWDMFDNLHNEFHADTSQWINMLLQPVFNNQFENESYYHAMGAGGQYPGNNLPQINVGKNLRVDRGRGQTAVPSSNIDVHGQSTWPDPREHLGGAMGTGGVGDNFDLDYWWHGGTDLGRDTTQ